MEQCLRQLAGLFGALLGATEFWSAIAGAVVGGLIAYAVQKSALREGRAQHKEDREQARNALAHSILFKVIKIHSNLYGFDEHLRACFARGVTKEETLKPWQFVQPVANPPDQVHFSPDEDG